MYSPGLYSTDTRQGRSAHDTERPTTQSAGGHAKEGPGEPDPSFELGTGEQTSVGLVSLGVGGLGRCLLDDCFVGEIISCGTLG